MASANRHGLDHDCTSYGLWTRLDVTTTCGFQPKAHFSQRGREVGHPAQLSNNRATSRSVEFLGESDEKPFRPADVAEPIRVFILDYFAYELGAALAEPFKRLIDVVHGEHDAEVA